MLQQMTCHRFNITVPGARLLSSVFVTPAFQSCIIFLQKTHQNG